MDNRYAHPYSKSVVEFMNAKFSGIALGFKLQMAFAANSFVFGIPGAVEKKFLCVSILNVMLSHSTKPNRISADCFEY